MNKLCFTLSVTLLLALSLWAGGDAMADRLTEPKGLITFEMPQGWNNDRFKNGRHFTREGSSDDPNILGVVPEHRDKYMTRDATSEGHKRVHEMQGHRLVSEKMTSLNGFEAWEGVFEASIRDQDVVFHSYVLISDTLMIDVHLNASKPVYKQYLPDLRSVVTSMRVTDDARKLGLRSL